MQITLAVCLGAAREARDISGLCRGNCITCIKLPQVSAPPLHNIFNMDYKLVLLLALAAVALAKPQEQFPPANYNFEYSVQDPESGNDFGHNEARQGDNTQGSYRVVLADGKELVVSYTVAGDGGFIAEATIDGVPLHQA
ncbi:larval cuticle protein A2B-like [Oratosquilla oratoria]|uniref:larval cuticle protein A2B-like n=1 Tax=Oratosquilla oratoria TaxID=337810 RepID=UPI003F777735